MEAKRGSWSLLKSVSRIDYNPEEGIAVVEMIVDNQNVVTQVVFP